MTSPARQSPRGGPCRLRHHHAPQLPRIGAERQPYAHLGHPLVDRDGDDPFDADCREHQRNRAEQRDQTHDEPPLRDRFRSHGIIVRMS